MSSQGFTVSEKKHIVSMRLNNNDRNAIQMMASRLFVRESELYRFAVNTLLKRMHKLNDPDCKGSDLLPLFIQLRVEFNQNLGLKRQQLFKIVNNGNAHPDKFVAMADIELLLLPKHLLRQRLLQIEDALIPNSMMLTPGLSVILSINMRWVNQSRKLLSQMNHRVQYENFFSLT
jgi:hypothetical protein